MSEERTPWELAIDRWEEAECESMRDGYRHTMEREIKRACLDYAKPLMAALAEAVAVKDKEIEQLKEMVCEAQNRIVTESFDGIENERNALLEIVNKECDAEMRRNGVTNVSGALCRVLIAIRARP